MGDKEQRKLNKHFGLSPPTPKQWKSFLTASKNKEFVEAVQKDLRADEKLKMFAQMVYERSKGEGTTKKLVGDRGKTYAVKYVPSIDRYTCTCGDWTYKQSVSGGNCKHINKVIGMNKTASLMNAIGTAGFAGMRNRRAEKDIKKFTNTINTLKQIPIEKRASFIGLLGVAANRLRSGE